MLRPDTSETRHLDLKERSSWTMNNASLIAASLGFLDGDEFRKELNNFIKLVVKGAGTTDLLSLVAIQYFGTAGIKRIRSNFF